MSSSRLFFRGSDDELDAGQLVDEVVPLAKLVVVVAAGVLVPVVLQWFVAETLGPVSVLPSVLSVLVEFSVVVGGAVVLLYVVTQAIRLADDSA